MLSPTSPIPPTSNMLSTVPYVPHLGRYAQMNSLCHQTVMMTKKKGNQNKGEDQEKDSERKTPQTTQEFMQLLP